MQYTVEKILKEKHKTFIPYLKISVHNEDCLYFIFTILILFTFSKKCYVAIPYCSC